MFDAFYNDLVFTTERLKVRKLVQSDFEKFHIMQSDHRVMQFTTMRAFNREENEADLKKVLDAYERENNLFWVWAVDNENDEFIGTCAIVEDEKENLEIGFRLIHDYWGKGYGTEIVEGLVEFAHRIDGIDNLLAYCDLRNVGSQAVLSKAGFVNLGIQYNGYYECEDYIYSIKTTG